AFVDSFVTFYGSVPDSAEFWHWDLGNGDLAIVPDSAYTVYEKEGVYTIRLIAGRQDCADTVSRTIVVLGSPNSLENQSFVKGLKLYPNPNQGKFWVEGEFHQHQSASIQLVDVTGRTLQSIPVEGLSFRQEISADLPKGFYYLKLSLANGKSHYLKWTKF
ncbi:MAG: T9SS type A sorting domain-containing protein, partial [Bacteroidia bacterium]|nr:T9SS type A sorting domain-containing protein [Bacteroidia bacterium]